MPYHQEDLKRVSIFLSLLSNLKLLWVPGWSQIQELPASVSQGVQENLFCQFELPISSEFKFFP